MRAKFPAATRKTGNCSKVCPHPALRATFPLGGGLFISNAKTAKGFPRPLAVAYSAFVRLLVLCGPALGQLGALGNGQAKQVDEAGGIRLVVIVILTEGRGLLIV